jgi:hypothetical protein
MTSENQSKFTLVGTRKLILDLSGSNAKLFGSSMCPIKPLKEKQNAKTRSLFMSLPWKS